MINSMDVTRNYIWLIDWPRVYVHVYGIQKITDTIFIWKYNLNDLHPTTDNIWISSTTYHPPFSVSCINYNDDSILQLLDFAGMNVNPWPINLPNFKSKFRWYHTNQRDKIHTAVLTCIVPTYILVYGKILVYSDTMELKVSSRYIVAGCVMGGKFISWLTPLSKL